MKPEPLNNKRYVKTSYGMEKSDNGGWVFAQDVKSAVEWLKNSKWVWNDDYITCSVCNQNKHLMFDKDTICFKCKIDKAFEDVVKK